MLGVPIEVEMDEGGQFVAVKSKEGVSASHCNFLVWELNQSDIILSSIIVNVILKMFPVFRLFWVCKKFGLLIFYSISR